MSPVLHDILENFPTVDGFDRELLAAHALGESREYVLAHPEHSLTPAQAEGLEGLLRRRAAREPLAYLTGRKEFFGLAFLVTPATLIPRPETELMVEKALERIDIQASSVRKNKRCTVIDVGTGSGNIIIALVNNLPDDESPVTDHLFYALDISEDALGIARENAKRHGVDKKIRFLRSDLLQVFLDNETLNPWNNETMEPSHITVLANLPYLSDDIYADTMPDVKEYEPESALVSGPDGLDHYRRLFDQLHDLLRVTDRRPHVTLFLEIGPEQQPLVAPIVRRRFPDAKIGFTKDISGRWRLAEILIGR